MPKKPKPTIEEAYQYQWDAYWEKTEAESPYVADEDDSPEDIEENERCTQRIIEECDKILQPIKLEDCKLPQIPMVRFRKETIENHPEYFGQYEGKHYIFMGEIIQAKGHCLLMDFETQKIFPCMVHTFDLEIIPPMEDF